MTKVPRTTATTTTILLGPRCFATRGQKIMLHQTLKKPLTVERTSQMFKMKEIKRNKRFLEKTVT